MTGFDENAGLRAARLDKEIRTRVAGVSSPLVGRFRSGIFEGSHYSCSHRKDRPGIAPRVADGFRRLLRNLVPLRVHLVLFDFLLMNRLESAQTHIERDRSDFNTTLLDLLKNCG